MAKFGAFHDIHWALVNIACYTCCALAVHVVSQIRLAGRLEQAQFAIYGASLILTTIFLGKSLFGVSPRVHLHQTCVVPCCRVILLMTLIYLLIRIFWLHWLNQLGRPHHSLRTSWYRHATVDIAHAVRELVWYRNVVAGSAFVQDESSCRIALIAMKKRILCQSRWLPFVTAVSHSDVLWCVRPFDVSRLLIFDNLHCVKRSTVLLMPSLLEFDCCGFLARRPYAMNSLLLESWLLMKENLAWVLWFQIRLVVLNAALLGSIDHVDICIAGNCTLFLSCCDELLDVEVHFHPRDLLLSRQTDRWWDVRLRHDFNQTFI